MKVEDIVYVIGRGNIVCTTLGNNDVIQMKNKIKINNNTFEITGTEIWAHSKHIGLILRPNDIIKESINVGNKIEII